MEFRSTPTALGCKAAAQHRWWSAQSGQSSGQSSHSRLWRWCGEAPCSIGRGTGEEQANACLSTLDECAGAGTLFLIQHHPTEG